MYKRYRFLKIQEREKKTERNLVVTFATRESIIIQIYIICVLMSLPGVKVSDQAITFPCEQEYLQADIQFLDTRLFSFLFSI